ncbi:MAG: S24 family peptidase [Cellulosilyticaceae bacterium]
MKLNKEQLRLVQSTSLGASVIRGIAGSGKTSVGMQRVKYLLKQYAQKDEQVLVVSYNKALSEYMNYLYEQMEDGENLSLFDGEKSQGQVEIKTIDSIMAGYFGKYCKAKGIRMKMEWELPYSVMNKALGKLREKYPDEGILKADKTKFLREEIKWIKGCDYVNLEVYQQADRIGRGSAKTEGPTLLRKDSKSRQIIFELLEEIDRLLITRGRIDGGTANILALRYMQAHPKPVYKHILVDEAQDLTKVQLEFIKHLQVEDEGSSIMFLMDAAQSIYSHAWLGKGNPFTTIGYDMSGKGAKLANNYLTTTQISQCAYSLLSKEESIINDNHFVKPSLFEKHGEYPTYRNFTSSKEEYQYVIKLVKALLKEGYSGRDIGIVSKVNKNLELLQDQLHENKIESVTFRSSRESALKQDKIQLLTMHAVKGLEFEVVILMDLNQGIIPYEKEGWSEADRLEEEITERKLMYVGMTRAKSKLFMCSYGEPSKFIRDIDVQYLTMQSGCKMSAYYHVPYESYKGLEQVEDVTTEEESVRQWVASELIKTYGYPEGLITFEYGVKNFSSYGKVDVAVINGRTQEPYIFVEVKKRGVPIQEAINQLKSYMNVSNVPYGIATNGTNIAFIDKMSGYIKDIPVCHMGVLPNSLQKYRFINRDTYQSYILEVDESAQEVITNNQVILKQELETLKVYADIAAGMPIEIVDEIRGRFECPREWIRGKKDLFILQVKGDSMVGADIQSGDLAVIETTKEAREHQILAINYNGYATLKKFVRMGDSILLMSENPEYEPINITEGDIEVIGRLVGVIKQEHDF